MVDEWPLIRLEDCLEALIDYRGKSPPKSPNGIPVLSAKVIKDGRITEPIDQRISEDNYKIWMRRGFPKSGDIVLTTEGPLGEVAQLDGAIYALGQRIVTLRGRNRLLDNTFLKFLLKSSGMQQKLKSLATGTTVEGISQKALRALELPIPSFNVQRAIARVLGTLDDKIELNRRMDKTLEAMARALFKSWFVDFDPVHAKAEGHEPRLPKQIVDLFSDAFLDSELGQIPAGWTIGKLEIIASVTMGLSPDGKSYNAEGIGTPLINGPVEFGDYFPVKSKWTILQTRTAAKGELILCVRGSTTGRRVVAEDTYCLGRGVCSIRALNVPRTFIYHLINLHLARLLSKTTGSVFPSLSAPDIKQFPVVVPDRPVTMEFGRLVEPLTERIEASVNASASLASLRDTLLPKLISGELRVKEAEKMAEAVV